jgi:glycosyltransferase 2 family protein
VSRRAALRVVQWLVGAAIIVLAIRQFAANWDDFRRVDLAWLPRPIPLVASALLVWAMYGVLIAAWRRVLESWGQRLGVWQAARIWTVSSLGKYIPGKVWAIAGMALMSQRVGVAPWAATGSAIILQALAVGTGAAVIGLTGTSLLEVAYPGARLALAVLALASILGIGLLLWPAFVRRLLRLASVEAGGAPKPSAIVLAAVANVFAWGGYGTALWVMTRGLLPNAGLTVPAAIGAFTASYLAGLLALMVPGGLVVREAVFVLMLQPTIGLPAASGLAIASRLLLTVTELGAAAPFLLNRKERVSVAT